MWFRSALVVTLSLTCVLFAFGRQDNGPPTITQVQGTVVDPFGRPIPAALVQIGSLHGGAIESAVTDGQGMFSVEITGEEPYRATVVTAGGTEDFMLTGPLLPDMVLRMREGAAPSAGRATQPTVSVNDLAAPSKAKSKLVGATKAADKSDFSKAWRLVNEAIQMAPNWGRAYLLRGALSFTNHNYLSAQSDFATAVAHDPNNALALTEMGKLYTTMNRYELARTYLQRALQLPPVQWPTYLEMARLDVLQHRFAEAHDMATRAMACQPAPPAGIHYIDGIAAYFLHHYRLAAAQFKFFLKQAPQTAAFAAARASAEHDLKLLARLTPQP